MQGDIRRMLHQQGQLSRKVFGKKECLHPEAPANCKGQIVKAHTVQSSGALSLIAEDGHVLTVGLDPDMKDGKIVKAQEKGIRNASTFTGFCQTHDNELFAPIEDHPLQLIRRHAFLLAYRCISRERFGKQRLGELAIQSVAAGLTPQDISHEMQTGTNLAKDDLSFFNDMGKAIIRNKYSDTRFYAMEFDSVPEILCSGATNVIYDFNGNMIQNMYKDPLRGKPYDTITFTLLPFGDGRGVGVFAWYGKSTVNEKFIKSLHRLPIRDIPNILVRFLFYNFENMYWSPTWWASLPEKARVNLLNLFEYRMFDPAPVYDLRPDGNSYAKWRIVGKRKNNIGLKD